MAFRGSGKPQKTNTPRMVAGGLSAGSGPAGQMKKLAAQRPAHAALNKPGAGATHRAQNAAHKQQRVGNSRGKR